MLNSGLTKELYRIIPHSNILTDKEECYAYSFDTSDIINGDIADAVIFVQSVEQVQSVLKLANKYHMPVICRGAGTNTVGACVPVKGGIILNFSKMNKILELNVENMTMRVEPGVTIEQIQKYAQDAGLFYPPDPSNLKVSTIGGSIAQNSSGARCFKYGATKNYVLDLLVVTSSGDLFHTGSKTVKNAAGYNLGSLFIGSEGTLGVVVEATLKLIPKPESTQVIMAYFDELADAALCVNKIIEYKLSPSTIDFMDKNAINTVEQFYPTGLQCDKECALIIEIDGDKTQLPILREKICSILRVCKASSIQYSSSTKETESIWIARRSSMSACSKLKPNVTTDDIVVPRDKLVKLIKGIQSICERHKLLSCLVGHLGDGSIHPQIPIDFSDIKEYREYKIAKSEMYQLAINLGGTISGEHGIGLEKKHYLSRVVDKSAIDYMRQIKKLFDPNNILNPYKIF